MPKVEDDVIHASRGPADKMKCEQRPVGIERRASADLWEKFPRLRACDEVQETVQDAVS